MSLCDCCRQQTAEQQLLAALESGEAMDVVSSSRRHSSTLTTCRGCCMCPAVQLYLACSFAAWHVKKGLSDPWPTRQLEAESGKTPTLIF